jgi:hypothetical protein
MKNKSIYFIYDKQIFRPNKYGEERLLKNSVLEDLMFDLTSK